MARIARADYFAGVFLTTILKSSTNAPMLCDASGEIKRVVFETNMGYFNVYVKYSTSELRGWEYQEYKKRKRTYWNVNFSENEYDYLKNKFRIDGKQNLVAIVCTNKQLSTSHIAVINLDHTLFCLKLTTESGNRMITVSRLGKDHTFSCIGVGLPREYKNLQVQAYVNHLRYFDRNTIEI